MLYETWSVKDVNIEVKENQTMCLRKRAQQTKSRCWKKNSRCLHSMVNFSLLLSTPAARLSLFVSSSLALSLFPVQHQFRWNIFFMKTFENVKNAILQLLWFSYFIHNIFCVLLVLCKTFAQHKFSTLFVRRFLVGLFSVQLFFSSSISPVHLFTLKLNNKT